MPGENGHGDVSTLVEAVLKLERNQIVVSSIEFGQDAAPSALLA
jgi:hypothetical protein